MRLFFEYGIGSFPDFAYLYGQNAADAAESIIRDEKVVVFTGAGVSADSGLSTFRDADGLWADYRIEDVCTPEALARNRRLVIEFYNKRRREMLAARPNAAHLAIAGLEADFDVEVITQNVDDLHERAGSTRVTHLHGELRKLRSSRDPALIVPIEGVGTAVGCHGPRRGAVASAYRLFSARRFPSSTMRCGLRRRPTC